MLPRDLIKRCARNFPNQVAYYMGDKRASWRQMDQRSEALAASLQKLGVGKGDGVGIYTQERIEIYEHFMACMKIGAIRVGINWRYAKEEFIHCARDSALKVIIVQGTTSLVPIPHHGNRRITRRCTCVTSVHASPTSTSTS